MLMASEVMSRFLDGVSPAGYARLLRAELGLGRGPVDLGEVCARLGIVLKEDDLPRSVDGCLIREPGRKPGILVNCNVPYPSRKRFTIAHELGHYRIRTHKGTFYQCLGEDVEGYRARRIEEKEANEFACEFLLPEAEALEFLRRKEVSLEAAREMAERFGLSLTAAALRLVTLSRFDCCALVLCRGDEIAWAVPSTRFSRRYRIRDRGEVPEGSYARRVLAQSDCGSPRGRLPADVWLWVAVPGGARPPSLTEEAVSFPRLNMALSLVTVPDEADEDEEEE